MTNHSRTNFDRARYIRTWHAIILVGQTTIGKALLGQAVVELTVSSKINTKYGLAIVGPMSERLYINSTVLQGGELAQSLSYKEWWEQFALVAV